eukprot:Skav213051  [mRNA]  locus=scaffold364:34927:36864:+ [translate_table: standard]
MYSNQRWPYTLDDLYTLDVNVAYGFEMIFRTFMVAIFWDQRSIGSSRNCATMVLHVVTNTPKLKENTKKWIMKKPVQKKRLSKKESSKEAIPLCRTIESMGATNALAKEQLHCVLHRLAGIGAPAVLMKLCFLMFLSLGPLHQHLDAVEYFAGQQAVTSAWAVNGYRVAPFEIKLDPSMDIMTAQGFCLALLMALSVKDGGFAMIATVCSSWVFVNRATSGRKLWRPLGNQRLKCVKMANVMVSRMALIVWLLQSKRCYWLYEQPKTSLMWQHPRMQQIVRSMTVYKTHMHMGSFGASSPKPTFLWSPCPSVKFFDLPLPQKEWEAMVDKRVLEDGRVQVSGNAKLKESQTYPREFGYATVRIYRTSCRKALVPGVDTSGPMPKFDWNPKDSWKDADLKEVFQFLSLGIMS